MGLRDFFRSKAADGAKDFSWKTSETPEKTPAADALSEKERERLKSL